MKKLLAVMLVLMMAITFVSSVLAEGARVMTSFYPIHILALNVFHGIDDIVVECMTAPQTGCLHDYQLIVSDMMKLAKSEMFIVGGAGMEIYLEDVAAQFPLLPIVDCSDGTMLLENCVEDHQHEDHHHEDHDHSINSHMWLNVDNAIKMVDTIAQAGTKQFPEYAKAIADNADAYKAQLHALKEDLDQQLTGLAGKKVVAFHEAFSYLAEAYGLDVAAVISHEDAEALSPSQIAETIHAIEAIGAPPLFADLENASTAVSIVAQETGTNVYAFNPIVTGDATITAYEDGMRDNAQAILDAFK